MSSPRWLPEVLRSIRVRIAAGQVRYTHKAIVELDMLELSQEEATDVLGDLTAAEFHERFASHAPPYDTLYVFKPVAFGLVLYVKIALRTDCVVISFHEDADDEG